MKILHAADLHLEAPLRGLVRYDGAPEKIARSATRRAFRALVDHVLRDRIEVLLLAGDVFDGEWRDYSTALFFSAAMSDLREAGCRVFMLRGNHDAASQLTRSVRLPDNVHEFSTGSPETVVIDALGLAFHGQGFATRAVTESLAQRYPAPIAGALNFGVLHTSLDGRVGHEPYAPCTVAMLRDRGYNYWALGHVHAHEVVSSAPWIVYPGNLQGRFHRETGPKGAVEIEIADGRITRVSHVEFGTLRWERVIVDARHARSRSMVQDAAEPILARAHAESPKPLAVRATVAVDPSLGVGLAEIEADLRAIGIDLGSMWIERAALDFRSIDESEELNPAARVLDEWRERGLPETLVAEFAELEARLPVELAVESRELIDSAIGGATQRLRARDRSEADR